MSAARPDDAFPNGAVTDGTVTNGITNGTATNGIATNGIACECFTRPDVAVSGESRKPRTRAAILAACRTFLRAGWFQPPLRDCCEQAGRSTRAAYCAFGTVEALRLEAADDPATRDAIVERVLESECTALSAEACDRLVRALVTGLG
jgi:hypothetical protein